jgi:ATP-binding cassette subfamily G (WHITE) protein 2
MGASGAGKTSLLNILSDRISLKNGDILKNEIYLNDTVRVNDDNFGRVSAYVMQDDILYQHFNPREALSFAANMKISNLSEEERQNRIDTLIKDLGLKNAQNTIIGSVL